MESELEYSLRRVPVRAVLESMGAKMNAPLSPTPLEAAKQFALDRPSFIGVLCVMSYQPAGRNGHKGLATKETRFYIGANHKPRMYCPPDAQKFHEQVGALLDIRAVQTGVGIDTMLNMTPGLKTPAQIKDLALTAWFKRVNRAPVETVGPVLVIAPAGAPEEARP